MAAPSQTSPNQASETTEASKSKETTTARADTATNAAASTSNDSPAAAATTTLKDPPTTTTTSLKESPLVELSYTNTQESSDFCKAKQLLQDGNFDASLQVIGAYMARIISIIGNQEEASMHECMAPLYYLYGTTLLYSMEEASDVNAVTTSMMQQQQGDDEEDVDDGQIAWENLETARYILERMTKNNTTSDESLLLDLAQVYLRCGDLSKSNGRNLEAIQDYTKCLEIRLPLLGENHRKVASMYHALGQVHMLLASEGDKEESDDVSLTPQQVKEHRNTSIQMHVACAKSFAGQIAILCGTSPDDITAINVNDNASGGGEKTTGMDKAQVALLNSSNTVKVMRQRCKNLTATSPNDQETVEEFKELLDEIQETIDEMETSREGIKQVSHLKAKAKKAVAASDGDAPVENADGSTTTIGFGSSASTATIATSATTSTNDGKPMMVIKKKKKRNAGDQKSPAEQGDAKRAKTE